MFCDYPIRGLRLLAVLLYDLEKYQGGAVFECELVFAFGIICIIAHFAPIHIPDIILQLVQLLYSCLSVNCCFTTNPQRPTLQPHYHRLLLCQRQHLPRRTYHRALQRPSRQRHPGGLESMAQRASRGGDAICGSDVRPKNMG